MLLHRYQTVSTVFGRKVQSETAISSKFFYQEGLFFPFRAPNSAEKEFQPSRTVKVSFTPLFPQRRCHNFRNNLRLLNTLTCLMVSTLFLVLCSPFPCFSGSLVGHFSLVGIRVYDKMSASGLLHRQ